MLSKLKIFGALTKCTLFVDSRFGGSINYIKWSHLRRSRLELLNLAKPKLELACLTGQPIEKFKLEEKLGRGLVW